MKNVRKARSSDAGELARLSSQLGYPISEDELGMIFKELESDSDHAIFVVETSPNDLTGYCHVFLTRRLYMPPFAELGGLIVDKDSRGQGLGAILLETAEKWAREQDVDMMRIRSNILREGAKEFYLNHGYQVNKEQIVFIKTLDIRYD